MEPTEYEIMFRMEESHWWYRALHRWILWSLAAHVPDWKNQDILDAGCGTGAILQKLGHPHKHIGLDLAPEAIAFCRKRGLENVRRGDIMALPFPDESFDAVICSSVLYHRWVPDVPQALRELRRVLRPGGWAILNLPAHEFLSSAHDQAVFTARRFTRASVGALLREGGFATRKLTHWTSFLFPAAVLARTFGISQKGRDFEGEPTGWRHAGLNRLMALEFQLLRRISLPFGVALLAVAQKSGGRSADALVRAASGKGG